MSAVTVMVASGNVFVGISSGAGAANAATAQTTVVVGVGAQTPTLTTYYEQWQSSLIRSIRSITWTSTGNRQVPFLSGDCDDPAEERVRTSGY